MKTRVKICGVRSPAIAEVACAAGADALGLVFYAPSPRSVGVDAAVEIVAAAAPLVTTVGLFVNPTRAEVEAVLERCALDCLQFHGDEDAAFCASFGRPYLRAVSMRPGVDVAGVIAAHDRARAFLLDAWRADAPGGTGETFDWSRIPPLARPWLLAGGLTADNVGAAIAAVAPPAVDVSGGVERERWVKDPQRIRAFMDAVRDADARRGARAGADTGVNTSANANSNTDSNANSNANFNTRANTGANTGAKGSPGPGPVTNTNVNTNTSTNTTGGYAHNDQ